MVIAKKKYYHLNQSPLYKLKSSNKLASLLYSDCQTIKNVLKQKDSYYYFFQKETADKLRNIDTPVNKLNKIQRRLGKLLMRIRIPDYVHSGTKGKSNVTNAEAHIGIKPVLTADINKFYPSTTDNFVYRFFKNAIKCSSGVAKILTDISTHKGRLPLGSAASMPLAFLAHQVLFDRLHAIAESRNVKMTCYVDDITFSGFGIDRYFIHMITREVHKYGLHIRREKIIYYNQNRPKLITGVIVDNEKLKIRNKHLFEIHKLRNDIYVCQDKNVQDKLKSILRGKEAAARAIQPDFRAF